MFRKISFVQLPRFLSTRSFLRRNLRKPLFFTKPVSASHEECFRSVSIRFSSDSSSPQPQQSPSTPPPISEDLVHHLERTSLVDFNNAEAIERLSEAISFANQLFEVDTTGVEPLITVLENEALPLRDDVVEPTSRKDIIKNASITEEDYFVAPPGNIPLEKTSKDFLK